MKKTLLATALLALGLTASVSDIALAQSKSKVLVVVSSSDRLELRDGKAYKTGYFLNELATPLRAIVDAGYTPVFANPNGDTPAMDPNSNNKMFFGGDDAKRTADLDYLRTFKDLQHPVKLADVAKQGADGYAGIFIPGGHAPMQDLAVDKNLGKVLTAFHEKALPTGIICHGPIALISAVSDPKSFLKAVEQNDTQTTAKLAKDWPYAGYNMTVFASSEERQVEGAVQLGGSIRFYAADALNDAGGNVATTTPWKSYVVSDKELITGQQPFSDHEFADAFVKKLQASAGQ